MASYFTGHQPGGGIASRQHVETPIKPGTGSRSVRPAGVLSLVTLSVIIQRTVLAQQDIVAKSFTVPLIEISSRCLLVINL
jgi:hypothetical protein